MAGANDFVQLSFLGCVNIAYRIVDEKFPKPRLFEVNGTTVDGKPTDTCKKIEQLHVVFQIKDYGRAEIDSVHGQWGDFKQPNFSHDPVPDQCTMTWPVWYSPHEAHEIMEQHGFTGWTFTTLSLRYPTEPGATEPCYFFQGEKETVVVGIETHTLHVQPNASK